MARRSKSLIGRTTLKPKISIIIAAYNEEAVIQSTIKRVDEFMKSQSKYEWEIICIDDGSKDNTLDKMLEIGIKYKKLKILKQPRNFGQGKALREGFAHADGDFIVTLDADLSYSPEYVIQLVEAILEKNVDIALTSPYAKGGKVKNVPFYRHFLSRYGNKYLAKMSDYEISTLTSVVRGYRKEVIQTLFLNSNGMEMQLEILLKSAIMNFKVCEVPATLAWDYEKFVEAGSQRTSKMKILKTVQLYLLMGWLSKPARILSIFSFLILLIGTYLSVGIAARFVLIFNSHESVAFAENLSLSLKHLVANYTHSIVLASILLILGLQILIFSMIFLQSKFYFEELYKLGQSILNNERSEK